MNDPPPTQVLRFGVFELDSDSRELRRNGLKVRLPDQSFQILKTLLGRPGEVVTREELRRVLWTSDTFVDFEVGLNSAVRKLREALDDSAENPRFVETLPRRGYRFVGSVRLSRADPPPPVAPASEQPSSPASVPAAEEATGAAAEQASRPGSEPAAEKTSILAVRRRAIVLTAGAALATIGIIALTRLDRTSSATGPQTAVAVLPFDNVGAGEDVDYLRIGLADEVADALSYASSLAVRPIASSRRYTGARVTAQQAGRELRAASIVTGHFTRHASELRVTLEAIDVDADRLLWRDTIAAPGDDVIALREQLTSRIREGLLPALKASAPIAAPNRPQNAEAYGLYLKSLSMSRDPAPNRAAIALLERATSLDPEYANGWAALGLRYYYDGQYGAGGIEAMHRAEAAARQTLALDPFDMQAAIGLLHLQVEVGRVIDAYDASSKLVQQRPDSAEAHFSLGLLLRYAGLIEDAGRECERAMALDPASNTIRSCFVPFMLLGRYDRALDFIRSDAGSAWAANASRLVYQRMGRRREAGEELARSGPQPAQRLTSCLDGVPPEAQGEITDQELKEALARQDPERLYFQASDLAYCGHPEPALRLLEEAIRRNYCAYPAVDTDPTFASIRPTPAFVQIRKAARACRERFEQHVNGRQR
jgi:DNA-binding winged helix-turn-helix (wHTH) protein/TolB-like protein